MRIDEMFGMFMGGIAQGLRGNDPVSRFYLESLERILRHTMQHWTAVSAAGLRCCVDVTDRRGHSRACPLPAAGPCASCGRVVCLAHAMVTPQSPVLLCSTCVTRAFPKMAPACPAWQAPAAVPRPVEDDDLRRNHLKTLSLDDLASAEDIREAQRRLARRYHPDRQRDPKKRAAAEKRMKAINAAASWLLQREEAA